MHDLSPLTPLGAPEPRSDAIGPVTLREVTEVALTSVAARLTREEATRATLAQIIGTDAPAPARHAGGTLSAFWMGPDQWMLEAPLDAHDDLAKEMSGRFGADASITEQTDAWCRFDLLGPDLPRVFELLCAADTHIWTGGEAQRCTIDHIGTFLICRDTTQFSVLGPRSFAGSLHHALVTACRAVF